MSQKIGFLTGSFDILHSDHCLLLAACKARCDYLIVGLVTDELGIRQKRLPILTYTERRVMLEATRWVDSVVEHTGDTKSTAWKKLKFDILFSSDEYFCSQEFKDFQSECPSIQVICFPKNSHTNSTTVWERIQDRVCRERKIIAMGVGGPVFQEGGNTIIKYINATAAEVNAYRENQDLTSDVLNFIHFQGQLPRNWRSTPLAQTFPMISGVNIFREVAVGERFKDRPWSTYKSHALIYHDSVKKVEDFKSVDNLLEFANFVSQQRSFPAGVVALVQRHGGVTVKEFFQQTSNSKKFPYVVGEVRKICDELKRAGVVHGDIHQENVLLFQKQVSVVDFGWVSATNFNLSNLERQKVEQQLEEDWDFKHFSRCLRADKNLSKVLETCNLNLEIRTD
jgi:glycerol-3-phosphate cytidylyltransferase